MKRIHKKIKKELKIKNKIEIPSKANRYFIFKISLLMNGITV